MMKSPIRPQLALTIGVTGHRPNRIPDGARAKIDADIAAVLAALKAACEAARAKHSDVFADSPAQAVVLSALAEGADRYAALAAVEAGLPLSVALPFPVEAYAQDFETEESRDEYRRLIAAAERVMILPGRHESATRAYDAVGAVILENADVILAIWDGGASAGKGGTTDLIERAAEMGMPIVHVDALGEKSSRLLWAGLAEHPVNGVDLEHLPSAPAIDAIPAVVDRVVRPPADPDERRRLARYLHERRRRFNFRLEVPLMLALMRLRPMRRADLMPPPPETLEDDLDRFVAPAAAGETKAAGAATRLGDLGRAYGFADWLGVRYAQIFRGSYVARFMLAALAVIAGGLTLIGGEIFQWTTWPIAVVQMTIVIVVLINTAVAAKRDWHGRWRESREVAERLRAAVPSWLLGQVRNDAPGEEPAWTGWYARAHLRALGLWSGDIDPARLAAVRDILAAFVEDQRAYHERTADLMRAIDGRVGRFGRVAFFATLALVAFDIGLDIAGIALPGGWNAVLIGVTAGLPVFGTASFGIRAIGDFEGAAMRSARMAQSLTTLGEALATDPADIVVLRARAAALADSMLGDVAHWRFATETRHLGALG
jgi:hypothetical protein